MLCLLIWGGTDADKRLKSARTEFQAVPEYVALDLETTGLDPNHDRVIEVGAVAFTLDRVLDRLERLVDPRRSVPEAVLRLTGIRLSELRQAGVEVVHYDRWRNSWR